MSKNEHNCSGQDQCYQCDIREESLSENEHLAETIVRTLRDLKTNYSGPKGTASEWVQQFLDKRDETISLIKNELEEQSRLLGMSGEREAKLSAEIAFLQAQMNEHVLVEHDHVDCCDNKVHEQVFTQLKEKDALLREQAKAIEELSKALTAALNCLDFHSRLGGEPKRRGGYPAWEDALESARKLNAKENR